MTPITRTPKEKESFIAGLNAGKKISVCQASGKAYNDGLRDGNKGRQPKPLTMKAAPPKSTPKRKSKPK